MKNFIVFLMLLGLTSCGVEDPNLESQSIPKSSDDLEVKNLVEQELGAFIDTVEKYNTLTSLINGELKKTNKPNIKNKISPLLLNRNLEKSGGDLTFFDDRKESFKYAVNSLQLPGSKPLTFVLKGKLKKVDGKIKILHSELVVQYLSEGNLTEVKLVYQEGEGSEGSNKFSLKIHLENFSKLYRYLLPKGSEDKIATLKGTIKVVLTENDLSIEGDGFEVSANEYQIKFNKLKINIYKNSKNKDTVDVGATIFKNQKEVGQVILINEKDDIEVVIIFNDDSQVSN